MKTLTPPPDRSEELRRQLDRAKQTLSVKDEAISKLGQEISKLEQENKQLGQENKRLRKEIAELHLNSTNSSKPPSSDGLAGPQRKRCRNRKNPSKRKPGGQPGHPGHYRKPVEAHQVSEHVTVVPERCGGCGGVFSEQTRRDRRIGEPWKHQVLELPPIEPYVIEYECVNVHCPDCDRQTRADPPGQFATHTGPRLTAFIAHLTVVCRMPRRMVRQMLEETMGIRISVGCTQSSWEQVSEAVKEPCEELGRQLPREPVLNSDETGWRQNGGKRWIWALVAHRFTFYLVAKSRSAGVLELLLGAMFPGILCSDRYSGYLKYHKGKAQFCWAHLKRNILAILEQADGDWKPKRFARDALTLQARLFRLWWKFRGGKIDRAQLIRRSLPIRRGFLELARIWWECENRKVHNLANAFGEHLEKLFCFIDESGVEPTNNEAERALRRAVVCRKISFGNRSDTGAIATGRLLTVAQTCAQQRRPTLAYLTEAVQRYRLNQKAPSLLGPTH